MTLLFFFLWIGWVLPKPQAADSLIAEAYGLDMSDPGRAKDIALSVYMTGEEDGNSYVCAKALTAYAWLTMVEGDYEGSLRIYGSALDYCSPDSLRLQAEIFSGTGWVYTRLGNFGKGSAYIRKSIGIYEQIGYEEGVVSAYNNYGLNLYYSGNYPAADSCFRYVLDLARKMGNERYVAAIINNLCMSPGNSREKVEMIQESISINSSLNILWSLGENYNNLGRQYYYLNRYDEALMALDRAEDYISKVKARDLLLENYDIRTKIYALLNDYAMAYNCSQKQLQINKQLQEERSERELGNTSNHQKLMQMQQSFRLRQEEQEMAIRQRNYILVSVLLLLCVVALFVRGRFFRKKKELELEQSRRKIVELELKKQEETISGVSDRLKRAQEKLGYTLMFVRCRNELLEKIREKIRNLYKSDAKEVHMQLKKLNMFIGQNMVEEKEDEISREIDRQNRDFCTRLQARYPEMTGKGKEMAVLLRMGLSSKEISLITGTPIKTVNMNRYRLRKQLGLSPEEDISSVLAKI